MSLFKWCKDDSRRAVFITRDLAAKVDKFADRFDGVCADGERWEVHIAVVVLDLGLRL